LHIVCTVQFCSFGIVFVGQTYLMATIN
jgi:hypothetical protein